MMTCPLGDGSFLCFLDHSFELQRAVFDIAVDEHTLLFGFGVCRDGNGLHTPIQSIRIGCYIGDMMLGKEVTELLHGFQIIGHDDIDEGSLL